MSLSTDRSNWREMKSVEWTGDNQEKYEHLQACERSSVLHHRGFWLSAAFAAVLFSHLCKMEIRHQSWLFSETVNSCREEASVMSTISRVLAAFMVQMDCSCFTRRAIIDEDVRMFKKTTFNFVSLGCGQPPGVQHGELLNQTEANRGSFPPGTLLMYRCDPGYTADGSISIICTSSGAWSHQPPQCIKSNSEYGGMWYGAAEFHRASFREQQHY